MKHYNLANTRKNERTHENIFLTVWTTKNQLTGYRQSDKVILFPRTIFNCQDIPYPSVSIAHKAAYISARKIINHFLASGLSTRKDKVTGNYDVISSKIYISML